MDPDPDFGFVNGFVIIAQYDIFQTFHHHIRIMCWSDLQKCQKTDNSVNTVDIYILDYPDQYPDPDQNLDPGPNTSGTFVLFTNESGGICIMNLT